MTLAEVRLTRALSWRAEGGPIKEKRRTSTEKLGASELASGSGTDHRPWRFVRAKCRQVGWGCHTHDHGTFEELRVRCAVTATGRRSSSATRVEPTVIQHRTASKTR